MGDGPNGTIPGWNVNAPKISSHLGCFYRLELAQPAGCVTIVFLKGKVSVRFLLVAEYEPLIRLSQGTKLYIF